MRRIDLVEVASEAGVARRRAVRQRAWFHCRLGSSRVGQSDLWMVTLAEQSSSRSCRGGESTAATEDSGYGWQGIRSCGWLPNRRRAQILPLCRARLNQAPSAEMPAIAKPTLWSCTHCQGLMHLVELLSAAQLFFTERKEFHALDSS